MNPTKPQIIFILISAAIAAIFLTFPQIDIHVASLFYNSADKFFLRNVPILSFLHNSVKIVTISTFTLWTILLIVGYIKKRDFFGLTKRHLAYLMLALIIGPGLIVNTLFKDHWGRARPHQVEIFGGDKKFTPPFIISDQCDKNCSFTSGDPSVGFYFFALAFAAPRRRREFNTFALALGTIYGVTRVIQGAHFFSDVIFSGIFVYATCYILSKMMLKNAASAATNP